MKTAAKKATKTTTPAPRRREPNQVLWSVIRAYLQQNGPSLMEDIAMGLLRQGHKLGSVPTRTVSSCVSSNHLARIFKIKATSAGKIVSDTGYVPKYIHTEARYTGSIGRA